MSYKDKNSTDSAILNNGIELDYKTIFESLPELYMLLDSEFKIINVSDAYANATLIDKKSVLGKDIFEVFPDNPNDELADGVKQLKSSLQRVVNFKVPSTMTLQKYDIPKPDGSGFEVRYWSPRNLPVLDKKGNLLCIVHRAEDVTEFVFLKEQKLKQAEITDEMRERISKMESEVFTRAKEVIEKNDALLDSEQNLSITLSSIGDAVLTTDEMGRITRLNPVAEELTGWKEHEAIGQDANEILRWIHFHTNEPKKIPLFEVISSGNPKGDNQDSILISLSGQKINIAHNCASIRSKSGKLIGTILVFRVITDEVHAKAFLEKAKDSAELANKAKDSFLATMSHEIRTPLSGLIGMLELLTQTVLSLDQKIMVQNALESGNSLLRILSDILDWSKIEEGKLELSLQPTSIHRLLSEVVSTYSHVASSKGLYLSFEVDTEIQNTHLLDPLRLSQILNNFVSNGIKFTKKGSIVVSAEHIKNLTYAQQIRFSVKDTGIGLTQEEQVKLFQNYSQATADTARLYGATGLGLAICRRLAHLMDGTIQIESVKGIGSIFSITLSLPTIEIDMTDLNSLTEEVKTIEPLVNSETNSARILAVDDHSVNLELLVRQLEMLGLKVDGAEDGEKALQLWYDKKYDLIITDCHMPHKDGYTLTRDIRKIEQNRFHKRIPIIAYTANILSEENEQCLAAGMEEVMIKPARISQLRQTLLKWLPHILNPISRETSELFIGIDSPFDFSDLKNIVSDKPGQILLLKKFNAHHQKDLGSLVEEISKGNLTEAEHLAHRLKGSCKVVGARNLVNGYSNIEAFLKENQIENARKEMDRMKEDVSKIELFVEEISNSKEGL